MADAAIALFIVSNTAIDRVNKILQENIDHLGGERYVWLADPTKPPGDTPGKHGTEPPIDPNWVSPFLGKTPQECGNWLDWLHQFCEHQFPDASADDIVQLGGCHVLDKSQFLFLDTHLRKFGRREERLPSALQTPRTPYATFAQQKALSDIEQSYDALKAVQYAQMNSVQPLTSPQGFADYHNPLRSPQGVAEYYHPLRSPAYRPDFNQPLRSAPLSITQMYPQSPRNTRTPRFPTESHMVQAREEMVDEGPNRMPIDQIPTPIDPIIADPNLFLSRKERPAHLNLSTLRASNQPSSHAIASPIHVHSSPSTPTRAALNQSVTSPKLKEEGEQLMPVCYEGKKKLNSQVAVHPPTPTATEPPRTSDSVISESKPAGLSPEERKLDEPKPEDSRPEELKPDDQKLEEPDHEKPKPEEPKSEALQPVEHPAPTPPPPVPALNLQTPSTVASVSPDSPSMTRRLENLDLGPLRIDDTMRYQSLRDQCMSAATEFEEDEAGWPKTPFPGHDYDDAPKYDQAPLSATSTQTTKTWDFTIANWDELLIDRQITPTRGYRPSSTIAQVGVSKTPDAPERPKNPQANPEGRRKATPPPWAALHTGWYETL